MFYMNWEFLVLVFCFVLFLVTKDTYWFIPSETETHGLSRTCTNSKGSWKILQKYYLIDWSAAGAIQSLRKSVFQNWLLPEDSPWHLRSTWTKWSHFHHPCWYQWIFFLIRKDKIEKDQSFKNDPGKLQRGGCGQKVPRNVGEMCMFWNVVRLFSQISKVKSRAF